jgi:hypothetical protein
MKDLITKIQLDEERNREKKSIPKKFWISRNIDYFNCGEIGHRARDRNIKIEIRVMVV